MSAPDDGITVETSLGLLRRGQWSWAGGPIAAPLFGGVGVELNFDLDPAKPDVPPPALVAVLERFLALGPGRAQEIVPHLWALYRDCYEMTDIPLVIPGPEAVWRHVRPRHASATLDNHGVPHVSVEADCDWDEEHGLQLVLREGVRWVRVSDFSGHLTEGAACALPTLDAWIADPAAALPVRTADELFEATRGSTG